MVDYILRRVATEAANLVGDTVRDVTDPRLQTSPGV
jgi:hypothetical protein